MLDSRNACMVGALNSREFAKKFKATQKINEGSIFFLLLYI